MTALTEDSQAIALLCAHLSPKETEQTRPLTVREWNDLARRIVASDWGRPAALLERTAVELSQGLGLDAAHAERVAGLLARGGQLAIELDRLAARGIWLLTRADEAYPARLKQRLASRAPTVIFGAGSVELLSAAGLAIVGSREVDEAGTAFTRALGEASAAAGLAVFSGAARGVDRIAMGAALEHGGTAVGVVADNLERLVREPGLRASMLAGSLALVTPYAPSAGFSIGNAMGRNKLIYCLADYAVVVASSLETGGTRAGAVEALEARWAPLFVRAGPTVPAGNLDLIRRGGIPLDAGALPAGDLRAWLEQEVAGRWIPASRPDARQLPLL